MNNAKHDASRSTKINAIRAMVKHTHTVEISIKHPSHPGRDYTDTFMFTPSQPDAALKDARDRVLAERGDGFTVVVKELHTAADTRARGRLVVEPPTANHPFTRRYYEV